MNINKLRFNLMVILAYPLLLLFCAYVIRENSMHEVIRDILYVFLFFAYIVFSWALYQRITNDTDKLNQEQKENQSLKSFIDSVFASDSIEGFVKGTVDFYLKIKVDRIPEPMCHVLRKNERIHNLFVKEIVTRIEGERNGLNLKTDPGVQDVIGYGVTLVTLNGLLKLLEESVSKGKIKSGDIKKSFEGWPLIDSDEVIVQK